MPSLTKIQSGFMEAQDALPLNPGTAAAPSLKFNDHAGTGMFSPSTGAIGFSSGGSSQVLTITSSGNVGINHTNPTEKLQVANGHINLSAGYSIQWSDSHERIEQSDGKLEFFTANGEKMVLSGDNLGIGTNNPAFQLSIHGTNSVRNEIVCTNNNSAGAGIYLRTMNGGSTVSNATIATNASGTLSIWTGTSGASERLRIDSSGRLLVGTDSTVFDNNFGIGMLQVTNKTGYQHVLISGHSAAAANATCLSVGRSRGTQASPGYLSSGDHIARFSATSYNGGNYQSSGAIDFFAADQHASNDLPGYIAFKTVPNSSTTLTERLRITSNGTILAGGQSSSYDGTFVNLELRKDSNTVGGSMTLVNDTASQTGATCEIDCYQNYRGAGKIVFGRENANNWQSSASGAASFLAFHTNNAGTIAERLRIAANGYIGVGTGSPRRHFHIHEIASATVGFQMTNAGTGASNDSQGFQLKVGSDGHAEIAQMENSNLRFFTNATERIRLTSGGSLNIGGDFTQTAVKAQVTGDMLLQKSNNQYKHPQFEIYNTYNGGWGGAIKFSGHMNGAKYQQAVIKVFGGSNNQDGSLAFETGSGTEKMRIKSNGTIQFTPEGATTSPNVSFDTSGDFVRINTKKDGSAGAGFIVQTQASGSLYERLRIVDNGQFRIQTERATKYAGSATAAGMYKFRLAVDMVGSTAYTIRIRGFGNGAHHVRLMGSHWTGGYQLIKESYYYTDVYAGLSELSVHTQTSSAQGAWGVSRPTSGQTGYQTDLIITKSAGTYAGGHRGMIEITTPSDLYLVSIT